MRKGQRLTLVRYVKRRRSPVRAVERRAVVWEALRRNVNSSEDLVWREIQAWPKWLKSTPVLCAAAEGITRGQMVAALHWFVERGQVDGAFGIYTIKPRFRQDDGVA